MIKRYYLNPKSKKITKPCVACIGNFDASHKGHQALYKKTISLAKKYKLKAYLITFDKDPNTILFNEKPIYSLKTRLSLYDSFGLDGVIIIKTNKKFYKRSAEEFIGKYLNKINIKYLVSGFDFRFGKNQKGNNKLLKKYYKNLYIIKPVIYKGKKISTGRIKKSLNNRQYSDAKKMLGYEFKK